MKKQTNKNKVGKMVDQKWVAKQQQQVIPEEERELEHITWLNKSVGLKIHPINYLTSQCLNLGTMLRCRRDSGWAGGWFWGGISRWGVDGPAGVPGWGGRWVWDAVVRLHQRPWPQAMLS